MSRTMKTILNDFKAEDVMARLNGATITSAEYWIDPGMNEEHFSTSKGNIGFLVPRNQLICVSFQDGESHTVNTPEAMVLLERQRAQGHI